MSVCNGSSPDNLKAQDAVSLATLEATTMDSTWVPGTARVSGKDVGLLNELLKTLDNIQGLPSL